MTSSPRPLLGEMRQHLLDAALELGFLLPGAESQEDVGRPGLDERLELLDTLPGCATGHPALDQIARELHGRVVVLQELLRLLNGRFAVVVDIDVIVQGAGEVVEAAAVSL